MPQQEHPTSAPQVTVWTIMQWLNDNSSNSAVAAWLQLPHDQLVKALKTVISRWTDASKTSQVWGLDNNGNAYLTNEFFKALSNTFQNQNPQGTQNPTGTPPITINMPSGGTSAPTPPNYANYVGEYTKWLQDHEIKIDSNLKALMENAAHQKQGSQFSPMTLDQFIVAARQTKEYHQRFIGIFNPNGTLKMTEDTYIQQETDYTNYAADAGINLNHKEIGQLFKNNVSMHEFVDRSQAVGVLQRNSDYFDAFKQEVKAQGGKTPNDKQLLQWVYSKGESNKQWTVLWNTASARYQAEQAGLTAAAKGTGDMNLSDKQLKQIGAQIDAAQKAGAQIPGNFVDTADKLQSNLLSASRYEGIGLTQKDVIAAEFGSDKNAAAAREKLTQTQALLASEEKVGSSTAPAPTSQSRLASQRRAQGY